MRARPRTLCAIRHNAGGQPSPAVESAVRARSMLSFGGFGVAQLSMLSLLRCSARKARQAYATRVLSVRLFSALTAEEFQARAAERGKGGSTRRDSFACGRSPNASAFP